MIDNLVQLLNTRKCNIVVSVRLLMSAISHNPFFQNLLQLGPKQSNPDWTSFSVGLPVRVFGAKWFKVCYRYNWDVKIRKLCPNNFLVPISDDAQVHLQSPCLWVQVATLVQVLQNQSIPPSSHKWTLGRLSVWSTTEPTDGQGLAIPNRTLPWLSWEWCQGDWDWESREWFGKGFWM